MKRKILAACVLLAALTACGGAGTSSIPTPTPTKAPVSHSVGFTVTALGARGTAAVYTRTPESTGGCSVTPSTVAVQAVPPTPPPSGQWDAWAGYQIIATEYDANCNPVNNLPTFTISDPTIVGTTIPSYFQAVPTPPPGGLAITGVSKGGTAITATFPDGTTSTVPVSVYGTLAVSCTINQYYLYDGASSYSDAGWSQAAGVISQMYLRSCGGDDGIPPVPADVQMGNNRDILFPNGYDVVTKGQPSPNNIGELQAVTDCSNFASLGTDLTFNTQWDAQIQVLLFKTASGACVKFAPITIGTWGMYGYYAVSDASGKFAY